MLLPIHPKNPHDRHVQQVVQCLRRGGVIIYPTDTVYGIGCSIEHPEAIERICAIKKMDPKKAQLSFLCNNLSHLSEYTMKNMYGDLFALLIRVEHLLKSKVLL